MEVVIHQITFKYHTWALNKNVQYKYRDYLWLKEWISQDFSLKFWYRSYSVFGLYVFIYSAGKRTYNNPDVCDAL